ncbi:hypothetical protein [Cellulosimicrobium protaetiae]|uniref:Uncharacterized protein n=1 Tax=Cellulosimicrobium protaetiae TaxID=2587808 RepID=A0A6M5UFB8_9MICO|nr:hypothetical protein [Cellulosimicrobium protaetiae]QJW36001.1 hypothetical protein FIC82_007105 [Cellulosimicrobium protaetiae]
MSTTTSAQPPAGAPVGLAFYGHVHAYAQQVRAHLADLRPEQVEELTDGLEADLAEAVVDAPGALPRRAATETVPDGGPNVPAGAAEPAAPASALHDDAGLDLVAFFGEPAAYAVELRSAAGLPPAPALGGTPGGRRPRIGVRGRLLVLGGILGSGWRSLWRPVTSTPQWGSVMEFLRTLTPAWWILRGWVVATVVLWAFGGYQVAVLPPDLSARVVVLGAVVVSVQWGRGRWLPTTWLPRVVRPLSVAAAVAAVPMALVVAGASAADPYDWDRGYEQGRADAGVGVNQVAYDGGGPGGDGVWVDGMQVSNLFVYDAAGDPVRDVQVFDDRGRPVRTVTEEGTYGVWAVPDVEGSWYFQPTLSTDGRERWNVYPLRAVAEEDVEYPDDGGRPVPATGTRTQEMPWPFLKAPTAVPSSVGSGDAPSGTGSSGTDAPGAGDADDPAPSGDAPDPADGTGPEPAPTPPAGGSQPQPTGPTPVVGAIG